MDWLWFSQCSPDTHPSPFPLCPLCCDSAASHPPPRSPVSVTEERPLFLRERGCHVYRTSAYFFSKSAVEVPVQLLLSLLLGSVGYFMVGLRASAGHFLRFSLGLGLLALSSNSLGQVLGALAPSPLMAVMLSPLVVIPFMLTSGFFLNVDDIPPYLLPLRVLSPHLYVFTALFAEEFTGLQLHCADDEAMEVWVGEKRTEFCYLVRGEQVLDMFHIEWDETGRYWGNMGAVALLFVGFRMLALGALKLRSRMESGGQSDGEEGGAGRLRDAINNMWRVVSRGRREHSG